MKFFVFWAFIEAFLIFIDFKFTDATFVGTFFWSIFLPCDFLFLTIVSTVDVFMIQLLNFDVNLFFFVIKHQDRNYSSIVVVQCYSSAAKLRIVLSLFSMFSFITQLFDFFHSYVMLLLAQRTFDLNLIFAVDVSV